MSIFLCFHVFCLLICVINVLFLVDMAVATRGRKSNSRKEYSMYVWTTAFDSTVAGCTEAKFMEWKSHDSCFTHTWNSAAKRSWLWNTCNLAGREISTIFVSDVHHNLKHAFDAGDCSSSDIVTVKQMLTEGHSQVPHLKIYGLYAVSDIAVSEKDLVKYIVHYNDMCAGSPHERFDGVAVNNEAYAHIKCKDMVDRIAYLDALHQITIEARKQHHGNLLTHYSMSWHWGQCGGSQSMMTWNGVTHDVNHHMIDIFDSTDVQVGYIQFPQISDRLKTAGYDYAVYKGKPIHTTLYTNKGTLCQTTFFPTSSCHTQGHSEAAMFNIFDAFTQNGIAYAHPCIHYFRGVYSSGEHHDWPAHNSGDSPIVG